MKVSEVMTPNPECVESSLGLSEAAGKLFELDVRHLPVVDGGLLVGILSDRDFLEAKRDLQDTPLTGEFDGDTRQVHSIMRSDPYSVNADTELSELIDLMLEQKLSAVPVVDSQHAVVGIVSYIDILSAIRESV